MTIRYRLRQNGNVDTLDFGRCFRPILRKEYFHFIGESFLVHPDWDDEKIRRIVLVWKNLPDGWSLSNSFGTGEHAQVFDRTISQLRQAIYVGGDFRITKMLVKGRPLYTAIRGCWKFSDQDFSGLVRKIVEVERSFWADHDFPYFLVTLIPTEQQPESYGGTGLTASFATFISTDKGVNYALKHLLAHELFHTWIGGRIGLKKPEELIYWFTEGFTEYYARLLLLRCGLITLEENVEDYNRVIFDYYSSPFSAVGNARILRDFWRNDSIRAIPYKRGDILAHNWNASIRNSSGGRFSLDNVMMGLLAAAREKGAVVSHASIDKLLRPYLCDEERSNIRRSINLGLHMSPDKTALGSCARMVITQMCRFELGFDYKGSEVQRRVEAVIEDSPAFLAGLRNGQEILASKVFYGDPTRRAEIRVRDSKGEKLVTFQPAGKMLRVPQYRLNARWLQQNTTTCRKWFGLLK